MYNWGYKENMVPKSAAGSHAVGPIIHWLCWAWLTHWRRQPQVPKNFRVTQTPCLEAYKRPLAMTMRNTNYPRSFPLIIIFLWNCAFFQEVERYCGLQGKIRVSHEATMKNLIRIQSIPAGSPMDMPIFVAKVWSPTVTYLWRDSDYFAPTTQ